MPLYFYIVTLIALYFTMLHDRYSINAMCCAFKINNNCNIFKSGDKMRKKKVKQNSQEIEPLTLKSVIKQN